MAATAHHVKQVGVTVCQVVLQAQEHRTSAHPSSYSYRALLGRHSQLVVELQLFDLQLSATPPGLYLSHSTMQNTQLLLQRNVKRPQAGLRAASLPLPS